MKTKVLYVAHPVSGDIAGNCARARRWLRWLIESEPSLALCMPWLPYVDVLDDAPPEVVERCLRDDCEIASRCDGIILVGGRISSGMQRELDAVRAAGGDVIDLTAIGDEPPASGAPWHGEARMFFDVEAG